MPKSLNDLKKLSPSPKTIEVFGKPPPVPFPCYRGGDREGDPFIQCPLPSSLIAASLAYRRILKKFENNPWICITVLNYTVPMKDNPCLFTAWADRHFSDSFCWLLRIISATPVDAFAIAVSPEKIIILINESCNHTKLYPNQSHTSQVLQTFEKRCSPTPFGQTKNGPVYGRLACTSSKTEILNKIGI